MRAAQPASQGLAPENQLLDPYINLMAEARVPCSVASRCAHAFSSPVVSMPLRALAIVARTWYSESALSLFLSSCEECTNANSIHSGPVFAATCDCVPRERPRDVARNVDFSRDQL